VVYSSQEPALPLHLQQIWGLNSAKVGQVYIAAVVPTLFCTFDLYKCRHVFDRLLASPITGWYVDKVGPAWITILCLGLSLPWEVVLIKNGVLALFIASFALESERALIVGVIVK
jgi:MFS transporter, DHA1 family, solute carrier family 18 (vesicular amine transporter), member 1/2